MIVENYSQRCLGVTSGGRTGELYNYTCKKQNVVVRRRKDEDDRYTVNIPDTTLDPIGDGTTCDCVNKHDILSMLQ